MAPPVRPAPLAYTELAAGWSALAARDKAAPAPTASHAGVASPTPLRPADPAAPRPAVPPVASLAAAAVPQPAAAPGTEPVPLQPSAAPPPPMATSAPPPTPPVVIDRIEIVTPPARPPAPDPLASLQAARVGADCHDWSGR